MKRRIEAIYGPPIPATYDSPIQNKEIEIAITNIQTNTTIKFLVSIVFYLVIYSLCICILIFSRKRIDCSQKTLLKMK
jgi:hypothetical protein